MCGIFGIVSKNKIDIKDIEMLALLNENRGGHATGFYNGVKILKQAVDVLEFLAQHKKYFDKPTKFYMGHTRFATTGDRKESRNAHPFGKGTIIGTHNGIISNHEEIDTELGTESTVDSEVIFKCLDRFNIPEALRKLKGYFGLAWVDKQKPNKLYLLQHSADLAMYKTRDTIMYSSDIKHLRVLLGKKNPNIFELKEDTLYTINLETLSVNETKIEGLQKYNNYTNCKTSWYTNDAWEDDYVYNRYMNDDVANFNSRKTYSETTYPTDEDRVKDLVDDLSIGAGLSDRFHSVTILKDGNEQYKSSDGSTYEFEPTSEVIEGEDGAYYREDIWGNLIYLGEVPQPTKMMLSVVCECCGDEHILDVEDEDNYRTVDKIDKLMCEKCAKRHDRIVAKPIMEQTALQLTI